MNKQEKEKVEKAILIAIEYAKKQFWPMSVIKKLRKIYVELGLNVERLMS